MRPLARLFSIAALAVLATSTPAAHADTYLYNFNFPGPTTPEPDLPAVNVSFDESAILTVDTTIQASSFLAGSTATTTSLILTPEVGGCDQNPVDTDTCVEPISSTPDGPVGVLFVDDVQLTSPGSYTVLGGSATLTITDLTTSSPTTVTPEPSSLILLGTGLLGALGAARRRLNPRKLALLPALVAFSHPLLADTVYTYTGNDFTSFVIAGPYTTSDSITGSFTVAAPLTDNLSLQQVSFTSYSFSDGVQTMNNLNSAFLDPLLNVATDSHGNILYWDIELNDSSSSGLTNDFIDSVYYPPTGFDSDLGQLAPINVIEGYAYNTDVGSWTSATVNSPPPTVTPEPSSLILLGTGLLTAIGAARRRLG